MGEKWEKVLTFLPYLFLSFFLFFFFGAQRGGATQKKVTGRSSKKRKKKVGKMGEVVLLPMLWTSCLASALEVGPTSLFFFLSKEKRKRRRRRRDIFFLHRILKKERSRCQAAVRFAMTAKEEGGGSWGKK